MTPLLRAVLLADLVDSTAFIERFGDVRSAAALQRLDLQIRDLLEFTGGRLIDKADGLLALFERPIQAVDFALRYQHLLRQFSEGEGQGQLQARVGIHVGELMTWRNDDKAIAAGAKPMEVEGLAKPVAARLMALALPGQILISSIAQTLAQRAQAELGERVERLRWMVHGRYRFKGVPAPLLVHEVGEVGRAPLKPPGSGTKAWREIPLWRRPPVMVVELLLFLAVALFYGYSAFRSAPALAFNERDWVVVGDVSNFTGDPRLEDSLDTALRIGLEQSRYVNLLSDIKVRDVLTRMGRSPGAVVDRAVGSEIALREGARALLLPSVAEVGGRVRVSVEVVDPNTQVTVYAQSADGRGVESALGSIDSINAQLRGKLGESLAEVAREHKPLEQVTTGNLDALRAFSLAQAAMRAGRNGEAVSLCQEAIRLDPGFAMAYAFLARLKLNGDSAAYEQLLAKADSLRARLTHREALMLDARIASNHPTADRLIRWHLLTQLYPDEYSGYYNYALVSWYHGYQLADALEQLAPALSDKNPSRASALYLQGVLQLSLERYAEALASFQKFALSGSRGYVRQYAEAHAATRRFDLAAQVLSTQTSTGLPYSDYEADADRALFELDQGHWQAGVEAMRRSASLPGAATLDRTRTHAFMLLTLNAVANDPDVRADLRAFVRSEAAWMGNRDALVQRHDRLLVLAAGVLAVEAGDTGLGREAMRLAGGPATAGYPVLESADAMLDAALATAEGHPDRAIARLARAHRGSELYYSHVVLMQAYRAAGRPADALEEANWLATHRGRAYAEYNSDYALNAINVVNSDLALVSAAEFAALASKPDQARVSLQAFDRAWPGARELAFLRARLGKLDATLGGKRTQVVGSASK
ncbi:putative peptide modification system cyclase [soil metagenome]